MGSNHGESFTFVGETDESVWEMGEFSSVDIHFGADHLTSALGLHGRHRIHFPTAEVRATRQAQIAAPDFRNSSNARACADESEA